MVANLLNIWELRAKGVWAAPEGSEEILSEVIQVSTRGGLERPFVVLEPSDPWLSATASGLRTPGSIRVEADPTGLTANDSPLQGSVTLRAGAGERGASSLDVGAGNACSPGAKHRARAGRNGSIQFLLQQRDNIHIESF